MTERDDTLPEDDLFLPPEEADQETLDLDAEADLDPEEEALLASIQDAGSIEAVMQQTVEELESRLEAVEVDAREWKERALRKAADLDNTRKRFQREREELQTSARESVLRELLPVLDDLERALAHATGGVAEEAPLLEGVRMVQRKYVGILERMGCLPVASLGQTFDPNVHEALQQVDRSDVPDNTVVDEFQRGYTFQKRLLRPALVVVGRGGTTVPLETEVQQEDATAGEAGAPPEGDTASAPSPEPEPEP